MSTSKAAALAGKLRRQLHRRGVWGTLKALPAYIVDRWRARADEEIDRKYGIDTGGVLEKEALGGRGEHTESSTGYEAIQVLLFRRIMRDLPVKPEECAFVDFGSGKGRALLMAAEQGFRRVIGVEISPVLHEVARRNVAQARRRAELPPIELHCGDAVRYQLPAEDVVCFFYNPFACGVMAKVVLKLGESLTLRPRRLVVIYRNPVCAAVFDNCAFLRLVRADRHYRIYQSM